MKHQPPSGKTKFAIFCLSFTGETLQQIEKELKQLLYVIKHIARN